jgi:hypothetical protein
MKYAVGLELLCIKDLKQKKGVPQGQVNFIKGKTYKVQEISKKEFTPDRYLLYINLINEQGELQSVGGQNKTKYFKIPRPEGVPITPPPPPKSNEEKAAARKAKKAAKKLETEHQQNEWKKLKKFKVKDKTKRIIRRAI